MKNMGLLVHKDLLMKQTVIAWLMLFFSIFFNKDKESNQSSENLVQLVERVINGDAQAEELLYWRIYQKITIFIRRKINYHIESEDIAQETFKSILESLRSGKINNPENFSAFMYSVCSNKVNDWFRKKYKQEKREVNIESDKLDLHDSIESALDKIINNEERALLKKAWRKLNHKEKRILYLHYFHEWGYEEIGDILDLKATTVRKAAERARKKIFVWLNKNLDKNVTIRLIERQK